MLSNTNSVLLVDNFLSACGGNMSVSEELALRLRGAGWTVLTTSSIPNGLCKAIDMTGTAWVKRRVYSAASVSVYSGRAFRWAEAVCWMLRRAGRPYLLTLHGGGLPGFADRNPARVRRLLESGKVVIAPSEYLRRRMRSYCSEIELLPNAIDLSAYRFVLRAAPRPRLVWLRSFHSLYNPALAVETLAALVNDFPLASLEMTGNDKRDGSLGAARRLANELRVAERVEFAGSCLKTEVPARLNRGDVFLNTPDIDNTPVSVIEAMACGLCVVSTNVGGLPYILEDGKDALLVETGDYVGMARAVRRIITEPGLAASLSSNARRKAERFDWGAVLPQWERLFGSTIANFEPKKAFEFA